MIPILSWSIISIFIEFLQVDVAIVEVGIGGEFDTTNILRLHCTVSKVYMIIFKLVYNSKMYKCHDGFISFCRQPWVCGVTSLGHDHLAVLGGTTESIAWNKAGIFKVVDRL